ncbi:hypothetical protein [Pyrobaculum aerophilum]|nr:MULTISPECIES: hypothetical protein [Pyrobaculum]
MFYVHGTPHGVYLRS